MGSAVAGRAARVVVFVLNVRVASRVVAAVCVGDVHGTESFKTRPWLPSESSALESYGTFRVFREVVSGSREVASFGCCIFHAGSRPV